MKVAHKSASAKLAIGEYLKAEIFLASENAEDLLILQFLEFLGGDAAPNRLQKIFRTEETADLVGSVFRGHGLLFYWLLAERTRDVILTLVDVSTREITLGDARAAAKLSEELGYPVSPAGMEQRIESLSPLTD